MICYSAVHILAEFLVNTYFHAKLCNCLLSLRYVNITSVDSVLPSYSQIPGQIWVSKGMTLFSAKTHLQIHIYLPNVLHIHCLIGPCEKIHDENLRKL